MTRIRRGFVAVPNPNNAAAPSWRSLRPEHVTAIVFWTKDARPLLPHLNELDDRGYHYYFQYTITGYPDWLEPGTPKGPEAVKAFLETRRSGRRHHVPVVWRYDPIFFLPGLDEDWHYGNFARIAATLRGATDRCVISFLDVFRKTAGNLGRACQTEGLGPIHEVVRPFPRDMKPFGDALAAIAGQNDMEVVTCAEAGDIVDQLGPHVAAGQCIDPELLKRAGATKPPGGKDKGQREGCGCVDSREIGMYDSCQHGCVYCYATSSSTAADRNIQTSHDPESASMLGTIPDSECPPPRAKAPKSKAAKPRTSQPTPPSGGGRGGRAERRQQKESLF